MRKNLYEAFTLVEMLIVMGILIILMAVGITAGRFAINRANDVAHQNAVDQIYTGLQAYYTDNREFPIGTETPATMIAAAGVLGQYLDNGAFDGGTAATYYYMVSTDQQVVLVCVAKGGLDDDKELGFYCNGNGFGATEVAGGAITSKDVAFGTGADYTYISTPSTGITSSDWDGNAWN
ncbi:MAG: hypothetical protein UR96_C0008G0013 [candidate division WS6 bacterium GW2011_GWC1_36_11]|uniref:Uncharacterized protein n=3 Tax=Candidatus Dojkabacteria TaxID=74243 RepID=A0A0G0GM15_9BACT|nr:MAG: hypothetical protein UR96_C0008G0013 [candidate division WS6 bacterium GW2011_GWC1_36_11]KKQ04704.1 MAG: hypothetical protein US14_C0002G0014 [candidate division WS6 bacterium GW2011_WS6_36_26]KKQ11308.1 MAG: hypothetical protein US23_C0001G0007 [candidate division WS6 bacterium GW2011_GWE1_36_69]KKQ11777.1 MAG: hypothetical protein US24_C0015G0016 [candidate division WS6 bacterium GW2011_GWC2_36_7]KKQ17905.1 MAG: hypothetical protein US29_C0003G0013 [candidate division WS6 bacterium GW